LGVQAAVRDVVAQRVVYQVRDQAFEEAGITEDRSSYDGGADD
jgi:hypothetical protein